jgi:hypothetical protein
MRQKSTLRWVGLALLGIVVAVGVAFVASGLASRQIGLASEPIDAGRALAPAVQTGPHRAAPAPSRQRGRPAPTTGRTPPVETQPPVETRPPVESSPPAQTDEGDGGQADD